MPPARFAESDLGQCPVCPGGRYYRMRHETIPAHRLALAHTVTPAASH